MKIRLIEAAPPAAASANSSLRPSVTIQGPGRESVQLREVAPAAAPRITLDFELIRDAAFGNRSDEILQQKEGSDRTDASAVVRRRNKRAHETAEQRQQRLQYSADQRRYRQIDLRAEGKLAQQKQREHRRQLKRNQRTRMDESSKAAMKEVWAREHRQQEFEIIDSPRRPARVKKRVTAASSAERKSQRVKSAPARAEERRLARNARRDAHLRGKGLMLGEEFHAAQQSKDFPDPVKPKVIDTQMLTELDVVCVVCDTFTRPSFPHCERWTASDLARPVIAKKLCAADVVPRLPDDLIKEYDCSDFDPSLKGMLLSRSPLARNIPPATVEASVSIPSDALSALPEVRTLNVCRVCADDLRGKSVHPPANSIANNNAIGILPEELRDASWAELAMTSIVYGRACIIILRGGAQRAIRGHVMSVEMDPGAIADELPRAANDSTFRVVIAGALTDIQKMASTRTHQVRKATLEKLLTFFRKNNIHYSFVKVKQEVIDACPEVSSFIDMQKSVIDATVGLSAPERMGAAAATAANRAATVSFGQAATAAAAPSTSGIPALMDRLQSAALAESAADRAAPGASVDGDDDATCDLRHVSPVVTTCEGDDGMHVPVMPGGVVPSSGGAAPTVAAAAVVSDRYDDSYNVTARQLQDFVNTKNDEVMAVRCGSKFVPERVDILTLMFPELFAYARGGLEERRRVPLSRDRFVARLLRLSTGRFSNPSFVLKAYNMIARSEAARKGYIRVQLGDISFKGLTSKEVRLLIQYQLACSDASRCHRPLPQPPADLSQTAKSLFKTMETCAGVMKHTDQYAKKHGRVRVFSMWNQFGPPTLMLTLNPNDLASMNLLHYAGLPTGRDQPIPSAATRQEILSSSPAACALAFQRAVDFFIEHVIGYDLKHHSARVGGGCFGVPIALFGAVEEQGRGSLHVHILVWIKGAVSLSMLSEKMTRPEEWEALRKKMSAYVESIMTTELQCPAVFHQCPESVHHAPVSGTSESGAAVGAPVVPSLVGADATRDTHFGQIKKVAQYRHARKSAASVGGKRSDPLICTCKCDSRVSKEPTAAAVTGADARAVAPAVVDEPSNADPPAVASNSESAAAATVNQVAFSVHKASIASVTKAREMLNMPFVDFTSSDAFNRWSIATGPITPHPPPCETDTPEQQQTASQLYLRFLVDVATVQLGCMAHDPSHRATCFKKGNRDCRFHFPFAPHSFEDGEGPVTFIYDEQQMASAVGSTDDREITDLTEETVDSDRICFYVAQPSLEAEKSSTNVCNNSEYVQRLTN
jgi:hypothetical protein